MRAAKLAIDSALEMDPERGLELESQPVTDLFATDERCEGMAAFVEKRKPNFTGR
jgi:enoyl-CoA hydratase